VTRWADVLPLERDRVVTLLRDEAAALERAIHDVAGPLEVDVAARVTSVDVVAMRRQAEAYRAAAAALVGSGA